MNKAQFAIFVQGVMILLAIAFSYACIHQRQSDIYTKLRRIELRQINVKPQRGSLMDLWDVRDDAIDNALADMRSDAVTVRTKPSRRW